MNNSIVVYRSEIERMQDEFWMNFMAENAAWFQYVIMAFFGFIILFFLGVFVFTIYNIFKEHFRHKRRQEKYKKLF